MKDVIGTINKIYVVVTILKQEIIMELVDRVVVIEEWRNQYENISWKRSQRMDINNK